MLASPYSEGEYAAHFTRFHLALTPVSFKFKIRLINIMKIINIT